MKIVVSSYSVITREDSYKTGIVSPTPISYWTSRDVPVTGQFDTIKAALNAVLAANGFDTDNGNWLVKTEDDGRIRFAASRLADLSNREATEAEVRDWIKGARRLALCDFNVYLDKVKTVPIDVENLPGHWYA